MVSRLLASGTAFLVLCPGLQAGAADSDRNDSAEFRALYRISDLNNFWFGYRYLDIGNDSTEDDITCEADMIRHGPTLIWALTF